jgi:hypothetical protein
LQARREEACSHLAEVWTIDGLPVTRVDGGDTEQNLIKVLELYEWVGIPDPMEAIRLRGGTKR